MNLKPKIGDENGNLIGNDPMWEITRVVPSMRNLARKKTRGVKGLLSSTDFVFRKGPAGQRLLLRFFNS
jgi:hypothetical protein